ncbi:MAG: SpoIIE family protein phosphatase [Anaerovoracaceae bacterium]
MELLLDNLRNALFKGKHGKVKDITLPDKRFLIRVTVTLSVAFLVGRASFGYSIEPVAIALVTVLLMRSKANIYTLPFICIGMLSAKGANYAYLGDMAVFLLCAILFLLPGIRKFPLILRALVASATMVSVKVLYYLWAGLLFLYDGMTMAVDLLILLAFIYIFWLFFRILDKGIDADRNPLETVMVFSIVALLSVGGTAIMEIRSVSVLHIAAFLIALVVGYGMGPSEGGLVGIICGFLIMLMTYETPALAGILGCCGAVSGLFRGKQRVMVGICYVGLALAFGMLKGFPELYISIYAPIVAAALFVLIPKRAMDQFVKLLSLLRQDDNYYELMAKRKVKEQVKEYADLFDKLALCSGSMAVEGYHPARDIMTQQFKGMAKSLDKIAVNLSAEHQPLRIMKKRYDLQIGMASYAKEGKISGDSCLCTPIDEGNYLIALSDGMGQGLRAAEESNLTVNTLYNLMKAGFEVELALRMINSILLLKSNEEIFSTVDMGFINLYTGRARIFKIGAAASFIKRGDGVKIVKMAALPLGIIEKVPVESISIQLRKGDVLVLVSDGITEAERGSEGLEWVRSAILEIRSKDPQTIADLLINRAVQKYGLREKDDMTVIVAVVQ